MDRINGAQMLQNYKDGWIGIGKGVYNTLFDVGSITNPVVIYKRMFGGEPNYGYLMPTNRAQSLGEKGESWILGGADMVSGAAVEGKLSQLGSMVASVSHNNYRRNFFKDYPELEAIRRRLIVLHAIPQVVLKRFPKCFTIEEMHAAANLRGILKENRAIHQAITNEWERFMGRTPNVSRGELEKFAKYIDKKFGEHFLP
jgi:hypothetical protein